MTNESDSKFLKYEAEILRLEEELNQYKEMNSHLKVIFDFLFYKIFKSIISISIILRKKQKI